MKIFSMLTVAAVANAHTRVKRDDGSSTSSYIELTGEETEEEQRALYSELGVTEAVEESLEKIAVLRGGGRLTQGSSDDENMIDPRKFGQWKAQITYLLGDKYDRWQNFREYGCHCLPAGSRKIGSGGYGKPVDDIDKSCLKFHQCYRCAAELHMDHTHRRTGEVIGCDGETTRYRVRLVDENGNRDIQCKDEMHSCRYNVCMCDRELAKNFLKYIEEWNPQNNAKAGFDREQQCIKRQGPGGEYDGCCGDKTTFPYNQIRRKNQCCKGPVSYMYDSGMC